ncbi:MAG TPA: hypothetical protein VIK93_02740, partial [Limnochordales bacterium]
MRERPAEATLSARVLRLAADLRAEGVAVGPGEVADALAGLAAVGVGERDTVRSALRCTLARHPDALAAFDRLFERHFGAQPRAAGLEAARPDGQERGGDGTSASREAVRRVPLPVPDGRPDGAATRPAYSPDPLHRRAVWDPVVGEDEEALRRIARRIARRLATRTSRRMEPARRGPRLDLRRSLRHALRHGGEPLTLL